MHGPAGAQRRPGRSPAILLALACALAVAGGTAAAEPSPATGTAAADETPPAALRRSLGYLPADALAPGTSVSWVDLRAVVAARPGAADPGTPDAYTASLGADDAASAAWRAALMGIVSGPADLVGGMLRDGAAWPTLVGFDPTRLDRLTAFGPPPANGIVAEGRFDPAAIGAALAARGFVAEPDGAVTRWCPPDGCDTGLAVDLARREPADPFGGRLGRRQPLAVTPDVLLGSAADATVSSMVAATAGTAPSLADDPSVAAALAGLHATARGPLLQAEIVRGPGIVEDVAVLLAPHLDPGTIVGILADLAPVFLPIAPASLVVVADGATDDAQVVHIVLVYPALADAKRAAAVVPGRFAAMPSILMEMPWQAVLDAAGVTGIAGRAVPAGDGAGVAAITLRAPLAGSEPDADAARPEPASRLYGRVVRALWSRDLAWLAPALGGPPAG